MEYWNAGILECWPDKKNWRWQRSEIKCFSTASGILFGPTRHGTRAISATNNWADTLIQGRQLAAYIPGSIFKKEHCRLILLLFVLRTIILKSNSKKNFVKFFIEGIIHWQTQKTTKLILRKFKIIGLRLLMMILKRWASYSNQNLIAGLYLSGILR